MINDLIDFKQASLEEAYSFDNLESMIHEILGLIKSQEKLGEQTGKFNIVEDELALSEKNIFAEIPLDCNDYFKQVVDYSLNLHHPRCSGYQLSVPLPIAVATSFLTSYLNNGMATYDSGPFATIAEKKVIDLFLKEFECGESAGGFMTSGGTLGNLSSLLYAREFLYNVRNAEHNVRTKVIFSSHAHYSVRQALYTMGMNERNFIEIDVDSNLRMNLDLLSQAIAECDVNGFEIMAVVATAGSSSLGLYDDLETLGRLCASKNIWLHVDAAHGGAAIFSSKYRHLMLGVEYANSIVIDAHKLLMCPALSSVVLIKDFQKSNPFKHSSAPYLWERDKAEINYDMSRSTYECTKSMMSIGLYGIIKLFGTHLFEQYIDRVFNLTREFYMILNEDDRFDAPIEPMSNILCFKLNHDNKNVSECNRINKHIYQTVNRSGKFFIAKTEINGHFYFRVSIMNPFTKIEDLIALSERIKRV